QVVDDLDLTRLDVANRAVDLDELLRAILAQNANRARRVVHLRDEIDEDLAGVLERLQMVVDVDVVRDVGLLLASKNRAAGGLVAARAEGSVVDTSCRLDLIDRQR